MRRTPVALISLAVALIVAGCSNERDTTAPRTIAPRATSSGNLTLTCDVNTAVSQAAKKYAPNGDSVFDYISQLKTDLKTSTAAATPTGFNILSRVADLRRTNHQIGTSDQGGTFVLAVLGCMSVGAIPDNFLPGSALGAGIFEVRSSGSVEGPAVAYTALTAGSTAAASPEWGAERASPATAPIWPSVQGASSSNRYLVYGYPLGPSVTADGFELGMLPHAEDGTLFDPSVDISTNPLAVGICTPSSTVVSGKAAVQLLVHNGSEILSLHSLNFCNQSFAVPTSSAWIRGLPGRLLALVRPTTLFAQDDGLDSRSGGLPSGWSPFKLSDPFINGNFALTFTTQPVNTKLSGGGIDIVVEANPLTLGATIPPMNVRLTIANNSGQPAFLTTPASGSTALAYVDAPLVNVAGHYIASYHIGFTKAGGYTLTAVGFIGGGSGHTPAKISNLFNVKNQ